MTLTWEIVLPTPVKVCYSGSSQKEKSCLFYSFRPPVMGIHAGPKGAYSIALSGGYEDDVDMGDCFTYTGEGTLPIANIVC